MRAKRTIVAERNIIEAEMQGDHRKTKEELGQVRHELRTCLGVKYDLEEKLRALEEESIEKEKTAREL